MFKVRLHPTILVSAMFLASGSVQMRGEDAGLSSRLIALHDKWFKAFDNNDSDTLNSIATANITL